MSTRVHVKRIRLACTITHVLALNPFVARWNPHTRISCGKSSLILVTNDF